MDIWKRAQQRLATINPVASRGNVTDLTGLIIEANGPAVGVGTTCSIVQGDHRLLAEVVGFRKNRILLMPLGDPHGIAPGATVISQGLGSTFTVSKRLLGRVIDPLGNPLDGLAPVQEGAEAPLFSQPPSPLGRARIREQCDVGVRALNSILTIGRGQRIAIMAGSGVGKSTLLGMIAKHTTSTVNVICLVGERGREVREFIERDLGPEGMRRSVVIVATSEKSALLRIRAGFAATAVAEYFRDQGETVNLMLDSITRFCMAQREIGLAIGEPPSAAGYTPSVFAMLPRLLERAGTSESAGSITGIYTVLVEGDDMNEPIADAVRGIVDGHVVLTRKLAGRGHFPAIDILHSVSRVMSDIVSPRQVRMAALARQVLADYAEVEDLITIGAYKSGQNPKADYAIQKVELVNRFLKQRPEDGSPMDASVAALEQIFGADVPKDAPQAAAAA